MNETTNEYLPGLAQPAPTPDGLDAPHWEGAREHKLVLQRCGACGRFQMPPEWICHRCHSFDVSWEEVEGEGVVFSWMRVHHANLPTLKDRLPYIVVVVRIPAADNVKVLGNLLGDGNQEIAIGDRVRVAFEDKADATLIHWRLEER